MNDRQAATVIKGTETKGKVEEKTPERTRHRVQTVIVNNLREDEATSPEKEKANPRGDARYSQDPQAVRPRLEHLTKVDLHQGTLHDAPTKLVRAAQGTEALVPTGIVVQVLVDRNLSGQYLNEVDGLISLNHRKHEVDQRNQAVMDRYDRH